MTLKQKLWVTKTKIKITTNFFFLSLFFFFFFLTVSTAEAFNELKLNVVLPGSRFLSSFTGHLPINGDGDEKNLKLGCSPQKPWEVSLRLISIIEFLIKKKKKYQSKAIFVVDNFLFQQEINDPTWWQMFLCHLEVSSFSYHLDNSWKKKYKVSFHFHAVLQQWILCVYIQLVVVGFS